MIPQKVSTLQSNTTWVQLNNIINKPTYKKLSTNARRTTQRLDKKRRYREHKKQPTSGVLFFHMDLLYFLKFSSKRKFDYSFQKFEYYVHLLLILSKLYFSLYISLSIFVYLYFSIYIPLSIFFYLYFSIYICLSIFVYLYLSIDISLSIFV